MIIKDVKTDLSEAAQEKIRETVEQAVEKKLQREMKSFARKLTAKFVIIGTALVGVVLLVNNIDEIVKLIKTIKK